MRMKTRIYMTVLVWLGTGVMLVFDWFSDARSFFHSTATQLRETPTMKMQTRRVYITALVMLVAGTLLVFDWFHDALTSTAGLADVTEAAIGAALLMALYFWLRDLSDSQKKGIPFGDNAS